MNINFGCIPGLMGVSNNMFTRSTNVGIIILNKQSIMHQLLGLISTCSLQIIMCGVIAFIIDLLPQDRWNCVDYVVMMEMQH